MTQKIINNYLINYLKKDRKSVWACHKAGVMKQGDGLFLDICTQIAQEYPDIDFKEE